MKNLEDYIKEESKIVTFQQPQSKMKRQRADKGASLYDFIKLVDRLTALVIPDVDFIPAEGENVKLEGSTTFNRTVIMYKVTSRELLNEKKPLPREQVEEIDPETGDVRIGEIKGQNFKCYVQFNIYAPTYEEAERVMSEFEDMMFQYTGWFQRNGVRKIFFNKHFTDSSFDSLRESLSIRSLEYYVEIEKLNVIFRERIKEIEQLAQENKEE